MGDEAELTLNPVMSFNVDLALRVAERIRPYKLRWFELTSEGTLSWSDSEGSSQRGAADLRGANFDRASLHRSDMTMAKYDDTTRFPKGFDPNNTGEKDVDG